MDGKRVLLTGASSGIGRALAKTLAARGAAVGVSARRAEPRDQLAAASESERGRRPVVPVADLASRGNAADVASRATRELGDVDVLINNAGVSVHGLQWALGDRDEGREAFETDFWSPLALIQGLVPGMR